MFRTFHVAGLAMASDIGILMHTVTLAGLLHRADLVRLRGLPWLELGKAFATAVFAGAAAYGVSRSVRVTGRSIADLLAIALIGLTWLAASLLGLWITRSDQPLE